jgi:enoyl-[acyl-carrier-protein] reductase (NADH)
MGAEIQERALMTDHLATLQHIRDYASGQGWADDVSALDAAIALMRGQSEVVTIDLGESGLLHNALVTGPVRVVAKSGEQVAGNIFQPHGGWEPLVISKDTADEQ